MANKKPEPREVAPKQVKNSVVKVDPAAQKIILKLNDDIKDNESILQKLPVKYNSKDLSKVNLTNLLLDKLEEKTKDFVQPTLEEEGKYKEIKEWRLLAKKIRTTAVNITKEGRKPAQVEVQLWIDEQNRIEKRIQENVENKLSGFEKEWERLDKEETERKQRVKNERFSDRILKLSKIVKDVSGLDLTKDTSTNRFVLNDVQIDSLLIEEADDEIFNDIFLQFEEAAKAQKLIDESAAKIANDRKVNDTRDLRQGLLNLLDYKIIDGVDLGTLSDTEWYEIHDEAKRIKKNLDEKAELEEKEKKREVLEARIDVFREIGFVHDRNKISLVKDNSDLVSEISFTEDQLSAMDDVDFKSFYFNISNRVVEMERAEEDRLTRLKERNDKKIKIDAIRETRLNMLKAINFNSPKEDLGTMEEDEWNDRYGKAKDIYDKKKREAAEEELRKKGDKVQWSSFVDSLNSLNIPSAKSKPYKEKIDVATALLNQIKSL